MPPNIQRALFLHTKDFDVFSIKVKLFGKTCRKKTNGQFKPI